MNYIKYLIAICTMATSIGVTYGQVADVIVEMDTTIIPQKEKVNLPFAKLDKERVVGATSLITQDQIATADLDVESAMIGKAAGVLVFKGAAAPGGDNSWLGVRGFHSFRQNDNGNLVNNSNPLIVIDGIANRRLESLNYYEIESITVLKDITAKTLYGAQAANGVVLVTTKRGKPGEKKASFNAEVGFRKPTHLPDFLNSYDYARAYNQALENDGLDPLYSEEVLNDFRTAGISDSLPDVDYYDRYLKSMTSFKRVFGTYTNTKDRTSYFVSAGYLTEDGLEAIGEGTKYQRFNVRGNVDMQVNKWLKMRMDMASRIELSRSNQMTYQTWTRNNNTKTGFFNELSSTRPNAYPIYFTAPDGTVGFGTNDSNDGINVEGELLAAGYTENQTRQSQLNLGGTIDFSAIGVEGLTWNNYISADALSRVRVGKQIGYNSYLQDSSQVTAEDPTSSVERFDDEFYRNYGFTSSLTYDRVFDKHALLANANTIIQQRERTGTAQPNKNINLGGRLNYMFDSKYVAELDLSYMGSNKLEAGNRFRLFPAGGLAWVASNESFLQSIDQINHLKLKVSGGQMGYDGGLGYYQYRSAYNTEGFIRFGPQGPSMPGTSGYTISTSGNPDIGFEVLTEYNIGLEAVVFNNLSFEFNYFNEYRSDIPLQPETVFPGYLGEDVPFINFGEASNHGVEIELAYSGKVNDLSYSVGGYMTFTEAVFEKTGLVFASENLNLDGQPIDRIAGLISTGFYNSAEEYEEDPNRSSYGNAVGGDLKYVDLKKDSLINFEDFTTLGNSLPRYRFGLNVNLNYKGFNLYVLGQGAAGYDRNMLGVAGYRGIGNNKYAANALNAWSSPEDTDASHPRLSTNNTHSYVTSSYWVEDAYYFTLRNIELSYTFPAAVNNALGGASELRVFARGTDLLSISSHPDFNADNMNSGISNGPLMKTVSLGLSLSY
ncbi:SusC/RagA family TonB-linked outer membrane protein [Reichenbachiella versicolor]|uniref:SusC/RagA family TonB-linked outer membrane protein n=1 Tax=Reichenbachiella versicolor TaxID=1821036 RepID=UPI000D6E8F8F|nr:SusC/RagA family TonB-linked outer membrane protein [Reichenbachiella versicolor]